MMRERVTAQIMKWHDNVRELDKSESKGQEIVVLFIHAIKDMGKVTKKTKDGSRKASTDMLIGTDSTHLVFYYYKMIVSNSIANYYYYRYLWIQNKKSLFW